MRQQTVDLGRRANAELTAFESRPLKRETNELDARKESVLRASRRRGSLQTVAEEVRESMGRRRRRTCAWGLYVVP